MKLCVRKMAITELPILEDAALKLKSPYPRLFKDVFRG